MNKFYKVSFIIAGCMVCIGLMLGVVGGVFGGSHDLINMIQQGDLNWNGGSFYPQFDDWDDDEESDNQEASGENSEIEQMNGDWKIITKNVVFSADNINSLSIAVGGAKLQVEPYDGDQIKIEVKNENKYQYCLKNETLFIRSKEEATNRRMIKLYIPRNKAFEQIDMKLGAGMIDADSLKCNSMNAKVGAGHVELSNVTAQKMKLKIGAGEAQLSDVDFGESQMIIEMGSIDFDGKINGNTSIDCAMGSVDMDLEGSENAFNYQIECSAGSVDVGDNAISGLGSEKNIDNGSAHDFSITCNMGSVICNFNE